MLHREIASSDVRIPKPERGSAVLVTRYRSQQVKAVILHPEDFMGIEEVIDSFLASPPHEVAASDLSVRAREVTETHETEEDYDYSGLADALGK